MDKEYVDAMQDICNGVRRMEIARDTFSTVKRGNDIAQLDAASEAIVSRTKEIAASRSGIGEISEMKTRCGMINEFLEISQYPKIIRSEFRLNPKGAIALAVQLMGLIRQHPDSWFCKYLREEMAITFKELDDITQEPEEAKFLITILMSFYGFSDRDMQSILKEYQNNVEKRVQHIIDTEACAGIAQIKGKITTETTKLFCIIGENIRMNVLPKEICSIQELQAGEKAFKRKIYREHVMEYILNNRMMCNNCVDVVAEIKDIEERWGPRAVNDFCDGLVQSVLQHKRDSGLADLLHDACLNRLLTLAKTAINHVANGQAVLTMAMSKFLNSKWAPSVPENENPEDMYLLLEKCERIINGIIGSKGGLVTVESINMSSARGIMLEFARKTAACWGSQFASGKAINIRDVGNLLRMSFPAKHYLGIDYMMGIIDQKVKEEWKSKYPQPEIFLMRAKEWDEQVRDILAHGTANETCPFGSGN